MRSCCVCSLYRTSSKVLCVNAGGTNLLMCSAAGGAFERCRESGYTLVSGGVCALLSSNGKGVFLDARRNLSAFCPIRRAFRG